MFVNQESRQWVDHCDWLRRQPLKIRTGSLFLEAPNRRFFDKVPSMLDKLPFFCASWEHRDWTVQLSQEHWVQAVHTNLTSTRRCKGLINTDKSQQVYLASSKCWIGLDKMPNWTLLPSSNSATRSCHVVLSEMENVVSRAWLMFACSSLWTRGLSGFCPQCLLLCLGGTALRC